MSLLTEHARELLGMPPEWDAYQFQTISTIGATSIKKAELFIVIGAVAPVKTRGKHKGTPNWSKADPATKRTAYFTPAEHDVWTAEWERKTGKCAACYGEGKRLIDCKKCGMKENKITEKTR